MDFNDFVAKPFMYVTCGISKGIGFEVVFHLVKIVRCEEIKIVREKKRCLK